MKFDTLIIGGGLAGLTCGIRLQQNGRRCAIISNGQSALDFSSGSLDLLNCLPNGGQVCDLPQGLAQFVQAQPQHPYSLLGVDCVLQQAVQFERLAQQLSLNLKHGGTNNHLRLTPLGSLRPTWLSPASVPTFDCDEKMLSPQKVAVLGIEGFNDFQPQLLCDNMQRLPHFQQWQLHFAYLHIPELDHLRNDAREFRSINISQALEHKLNFQQLVAELKKVAAGAKIAFLPACFGLDNDDFLQQLQQACGIKLFELPTLPPSLLGIRQHRLLQKAFEQAGGIMMKGDSVLRAEMTATQVTALYTRLNEEVALSAEHYVLASGSFFSNGLVASFDQIIEPIFGLDLFKQEQRSQWTHHRFAASQPYQQFGAKINARCQAIKQQQVVENLYAIGAVVGGYDAIHQGCGSGVAVVTALAAAEQILQGETQ
ncbi:glycerol 3-phosphate dehydrogenase (quinone) subunit B [Pasteurella testudinis DSM 23072]|uniref:Anaerobic glycerol-3-phosphate dehydrogenase subunit B n=1 Tax=Pasteurella testudinis DSM 23072 TaxID=1122938 RepID=A0A1W1V2T4_9PAST|nr:glycerol-3-phosphate dehydrogenase subunit GlpB [Pasteurella testudinis]SMB87600.1 glycerol 3-phosphate dehydrogenase (quinone) subunit B [Pasteurella testudinis DSM 23072]SUB50498.1 anaerobic glycerol-3-phosphate dehydrogenase subunit B [Pasteurella testudinis]